ncbi:hypothetical protein G3580_12755 [Nitrogeniibacter mangrovi]|uniref:Uncharacterized protein n=1 Tax=Nitrogeniibacter mangrovi TaxID=2016596 RepID=A0A6C1B850_9RHOO|nr:hypothetical protein [Nitrogeniibacter mangrovi]QID18424.1 hypothetical protein G3580_12755 [Nitrogeniibacter mangrovi]
MHTARTRRAALVAACVASLGLSSAGHAACDTETFIQGADVDQLEEFFKDQNKQVVTFIGYSGAGYEDPSHMLGIASDLLDQFNPATTIINIGATPEGIGAVYALAKQKGFVTTGIVSTQAKAYGVELSTCLDYAFFVQDDTWGGFLADGHTLSPTSAAMVGVSQVLIGIGGGEVGRDELLAARHLGKSVRFFPADMNHQTALQKARKNGRPAPTDFGGAAAAAFRQP